MRLQDLHAWNLSPADAIILQRQLASKVVREGDPQNVRLVAAADVAFPGNRRGWHGGVARAAVVLMSYEAGALAIVESHLMEAPVAFPYVPGLLSFRETPAIALAFERLSAEPDLVLVDGHGIAHPRRFGFASHVGLLAGIPTIGVAKSRLCGEAGVLAPERGAMTPLVDHDEVVGVVLRTRANVRPVYVSIGHLVSLESAADWVQRLSPAHRSPEPIRLADMLSKGRQLP